MNNLQNHIENYLDYCRTQKCLDKKTLKAYRIDLRQFSEQISVTEASDLTSATLETYVAKLHQQYAPKTVKRKIASLKALFHYFEYKEIIDHNCECFKQQLSRVIDFSDDKAIMVNNADWLLDLNYVEFLRDIGSCFSVNKMLTAECFKQRLEKGLSFLEFNYMLMQSYDFLMLNRKYNCKIELGGDDQWSNILGGIDLCRRKDQKQVYGMTFTLLTNSEGKKMGKTQSGAVWLDPKKTTPYDFYQYWVNVQDADVIKCLKLLTFVPMDEIRKMEKWEGKELNEAKRILAYEVTKLVHGEEEAEKAKKTAEEVFAKGGVSADMPTSVIPDVVGMGVLDMLVKTGLLPSKGEARRLVQQNGLSINDVKYNDVNGVVTEDMITDEGMIIKKGKKTFHRVVTQ